MPTRKNHAYYLSRPILTADEVGTAFIMDGLRAVKAYRAQKPYTQFTAEERQVLAGRIPPFQLDEYQKYFNFYCRLAESPNSYSECSFTAQSEYWHLRHLLQAKINAKQGLSLVKRRRGRPPKDKTLGPSQVIEELFLAYKARQLLTDEQQKELASADEEIIEAKETIREQYRLLYAFHAFLSIIGPRGFLKARGPEFADCLQYLYPRVDHHFISVANAALWATHDFLKGKVTDEPEEISDPVYKWIYTDDLKPEQSRLDAVADNYNIAWFYSNQRFIQIVLFIAGVTHELYQP